MHAGAQGGKEPGAEEPSSHRTPGDVRLSRLALVVLCGLLVPATARSQVVSREEALAAVFPGAEVRSESVFLSGDQAERISEISREEVTGRLFARYIAAVGDSVVGRAYVDTHVVRTKRESLLVSLEPDGRVRRIDVTAFLEPPEYLAPQLWRAQYEGRPLGDDLRTDGAIRPIGGATLTSRSVNAAVRRVLAMDMVLEGRDPGPPR